MKKFTVSLIVGLLMSVFALAGGDIAPVEPEVVIPAPAPAVVDESGLYIGVAYSAAKAKEEYDAYMDVNNSFSGKGEVDYDGIMGQLGYKFNKYLALEGRYWHSIGDGDWSWSGSGIEDGVPYSDSESGSNDGDELRAWGIYLKPIFPITEQFDVYGLLGYGNVELSDNHGKWLDEDGFQWGAGVSYDITEDLSIFVDYVRLLDEDGSETYVFGQGSYDLNWDNTVYTINVGLTYKF